MKYLLVFLIFCLSVLTVRAEEISDQWISSNTFFSRVIYIKKGMATTIQFSSLMDYYVTGDSEIVEVNPLDEHTLQISASLPDETTNLNVRTKNGSFVFVIKTLDYNSKRQPNLQINIGKLANGNLEELNKEIEKEKQQWRLSKERNPKFDYAFSMYVNPSAPFKTIKNLYCKVFYCDFKSIAPRNIWTDGKFTYFDFRNEDGTPRAAPVIQEVVSGIDVPVNQFAKEPNIEGDRLEEIEPGILVVQTLSRVLTLRANGTYLCVKYNGRKFNVH